MSLSRAKVHTCKPQVLQVTAGMPSAPSLAPTAQRSVGTTAGHVRAGRASTQGQPVSTLLGTRGSFKRNALGGVGIAGTAIWVSPLVAWILIGGLLIAVGMIFAVAAVAVLRADATLSPFDRLIRFAGLLLNRAPARFLPSTAAVLRVVTCG